MAQMPRFIGTALHFADQRAPFVARAPVIFPVGSRVLAAMIEELDIGALERLDLGLDEGVQSGQLAGDLARQFEVHGASPGALFYWGTFLECDPPVWMRAADAAVDREQLSIHVGRIVARQKRRRRGYLVGSPGMLTRGYITD